ncbi:MAG: amidohydrolase, partial [Synergistales bacterium]|nr:amidohydrolase [Synergistales bacterium]
MVMKGIDPSLVEQLRSDAEEAASETIAWRREFHQFPELAFEETVTSSRIAAVLSEMPSVRVIRGFGAPTCVLGILREDIDAPALTLRADIDALA